MAAPAGGRLTGIAGASPDLIRLRRARDRMDREYAEPLDVPALARTALMSPGHFSRSFRTSNCCNLLRFSQQRWSPGPGPAATRRAPAGR